MMSLEKILENQDLKNYTSKVEEILGYARNSLYHEINSEISPGDKKRINKAEKEYQSYIKQTIGIIGKLTKTGELEKVQTAENIANLLMSENYILEYKPTFFDKIKDLFSGLFNKGLRSSDKTINQIYKLENMIINGYKKGIDKIKKEYNATQDSNLLKELKKYQTAREKTADFVKRLKEADLLLKTERSLYKENEIDTAMQVYNDLKEYVDNNLKDTAAYNPLKVVIDFEYDKKFKDYTAKQQQQKTKQPSPQQNKAEATAKPAATPQKVVNNSKQK